MRNLLWNGSVAGGRPRRPRLRRFLTGMAALAVVASIVAAASAGLRAVPASASSAPQAPPPGVESGPAGGPGAGPGDDPAGDPAGRGDTREGTPEDTPGDAAGDDPAQPPGDEGTPPPAAGEPAEQPPSGGAPGEGETPEKGEEVRKDVIEMRFTPGPFPREPEVGGFVIEVGELSGKRLSVRRVRVDTSERKSEPQARLELRNVSLEGLNIYKNLATPSGMPFHLQITTRNKSDKVTITGEMRVNVSELYARKMVGKLAGVIPITVKNYWTTEPEEDLLTRLAGLLGLDIEAEQMKLNAHRLEVERIVIPNLVLTIDEGHLSSEVK